MLLANDFSQFLGSSGLADTDRRNHVDWDRCCCLDLLAVACLAVLIGSSEAVQPIASLNDLAERIALDKLSRAPATFDPAAVEVATRWPPEPPPSGDRYSHAWFAGYLQRHDGTGQPIWSVKPRLAFAVLVEFGGSGSRTSGAIAQQIAADLLDVFGSDLDEGTLTTLDSS